MATVNPYQPPQSPAEPPAYPSGTLTLWQSLRFVLASMGIFALLGGLAGLIIGVAVPQYYQQLFNLSDSGQAIAAGVSLGVMQGGGAGIGVGVALTAIIAWLQVRLQRIAALRQG